MPLVSYGFEIDRKYHFVIEQTLEDGIVMSKVIVDGEVVYSQQNNYYNNYNNVIAYVSDPWKDPFDGCLDNLKFTPGSKYYCIVYSIVSFDFPNKIFITHILSSNFYFIRGKLLSRH